jgi:hypothetical protein
MGATALRWWTPRLTVPRKTRQKSLIYPFLAETEKTSSRRAADVRVHPCAASKPTTCQFMVNGAAVILDASTRSPVAKLRVAVNPGARQRGRWYHHCGQAGQEDASTPSTIWMVTRQW